MTLPKEVEPIKTTRDINKIKQYLYGKENKRDYCIFVVGINVGLRAGDLLSLKINDVTDGNTIFDTVTIKEQKTGKTRNFALNKNAKDAIQLYINSLADYDFNDYLFKSRKGGHLGVRPLHHIIKTIVNKSIQHKQQQWFFDKAIKQLEKECKSIECNAIIHLRHQIIKSNCDVYTYEFYGTAVNIVK